MTPEGRVQRDVREALGAATDLVMWRISPSAPGSDVPTAPAGIADLNGILAPWGRWIAIEVKAANGRLSTAQLSWLALARRMGAFTAVCRSADEALASIDAARAECRARWGA